MQIVYFVIQDAYENTVERCEFSSSESHMMIPSSLDWMWKEYGDA